MHRLRRLLTEDHGSIASSEMECTLIAYFPNLTVGVKMGCSPRFTCPIKDVHEAIRIRERDNPADYCREVFVPVNVYEPLRALLGLSKKETR